MTQWESYHFAAYAKIIGGKAVGLQGSPIVPNYLSPQRLFATHKEKTLAFKWREMAVTTWTNGTPSRYSSLLQCSGKFTCPWTVLAIRLYLIRSLDLPSPLPEIRSIDEQVKPMMTHTDRSSLEHGLFSKITALTSKTNPLCWEKK